jgi:hypothetical protein
LVLAAISFAGSEQFYFIEVKENTDINEEIFYACLPDIKRLQFSEFNFKRDNTAPPAAL